MNRAYITQQNIVFALAFALTILIAFDFLPRVLAFAVFGLYGGYMLVAPVTRGTELFVRAIPLFIALPLAETFDNFNMWRALIIILAVRLVLAQGRWRKIVKPLRNRTELFHWMRTNWMETFGIVYFIIAALSLYVAPDTTAGIKRLIYLGNAALLFIVVRWLIAERRSYLISLSKNFAFSAAVVVIFGFIQFLAAYFVPAWRFHHWWGSIVSRNLYGQEWANIVLDFGNTWFSYSGDTLRLRMFSLFPDSHSFPMYVLMALPALLVAGAVAMPRLRQFVEAPRRMPVRTLLLHWRVGLATAGLAVMLLALILTGTRGIWISVVAALCALPLIAFWGRAHRLAGLLSLVALLFVLMFPVYQAVVTFPQFQETDAASNAGFSRIRSLIDFSETSNQGRVYIWRTTIESIERTPVWGVGIGNYPIVLSESISASRMGASAHNLYLHIASTVGLVGFIAFLGIAGGVVRSAIVIMRRNGRSLYALYAATALFSLAWIAGYSMTDAALFDERALLAFMLVLGTFAGLHQHDFKRTSV
ncbi:MAG: O-antigen ligase family protein [Candidatus Spechtbacterales bacterium]